MITTCNKPTYWTVVYPVLEFLRYRSTTGAGLGIATILCLISCRNVSFPKFALEQKLLFMDCSVCGDFRKSPIANHELHPMLFYGSLAVPACNDRSVLLVVVVPDVVDLSVEFGNYLDLGLQPVRVGDIFEWRDWTLFGFRLGNQYLILLFPRLKLP
jgi:hypothetical protein